MTVSDCSPESVLGLAHVLSLVLGEHLDNHQGALSLLYVNIDEEVLARLDRLTVKVPRDLGVGVSREEHPEGGTFPVRHGEVTQRHEEPRWFVLWRPQRDDGAGFSQGSCGRVSLWLLFRGLGGRLCLGCLSGHDRLLGYRLLGGLWHWYRLKLYKHKERTINTKINSDSHEYASTCIIIRLPTVLFQTYDTYLG